MAKRQGGLGRDFYSLLDDNMMESKQESKTSIKISRITPRGDQPRKNFDENALQVLADSIREHGVIQPIVLRELDDVSENYEIIAGERRWRAARMAGLDEIPAVVMTGDELKIAEIALIENVQRKDLNPIEEAMAYKALIERFGLKQEEVAQQAGKSRSAVANMLRLLELPDEVLIMVQDEKLSMGHARAILGLEDEEKMLPLAEMTADKELSVREVEALVRRYNTVVEEIPETVAWHVLYIESADKQQTSLVKGMCICAHVLKEDVSVDVRQNDIVCVPLKEGSVSAAGLDPCADAVQACVVVS